MEFEPKKYIATGLVLLAGGTVLAGCGTKTSVTDEPLQIESTAPQDGKYTWKDDTDDHITRTISCEGTSLRYIGDSSYLFNNGGFDKTFLQDPACEDQELSEQEVADFLISQALDVKPKN